jgi:O-antigen/teichoic acid export membrane protein
LPEVLGTGNGLSENLRLRYSGLILFASRIISIFTGLAFSIIVIRTLSIDEFGAWTNIGNLVRSLSLAAPLIPFWAARYTARRFQGAMKLGVFVNLFLSVVAAVVAVILGPFFASAALTSSIFYVYSTVLIVQTYLLGSVEPIVSVRRPQTLGYAFLGNEFVKVAFGYVLVAVYRLGIPGAILALALANAVQTAFYVVSLRELWLEKANLKYLREWVKGSPLSLYGLFATILSTIDVFLLLFRGGDRALAFYATAAIIAAPVGYTSVLSIALYPRILEKSRAQDVETSLKITLLFAVPLTLAIIGLGPSLLSILKSSYVPSSTTAALLAIAALAGSMTTIMDAIITGTETMDAQGTIAFRDLVRSRIFRATTGSYVGYIIYLPILWIVLGTVVGDPLRASQITALLVTVLGFSILSYKYWLARKFLSFHFPVKSAGIFFLAGGLLVSTTVFLTQPLRYFITIPLFAVGTALYLGILYFVEEEANLLIRAMIARFRNLRYSSGSTER